jgi:hypothetical protein
MYIPPKKSEEQIQLERQIKRAGFDSQFWAVLRANIEEEVTARYRLLPSIETLEQLNKVKGEILAFEQILGFEVPYKPAKPPRT